MPGEPRPKKTLPFAPSLLVTTLGAAVGLLLLMAMLHLAPQLGLARVDVPLLLGSVFVEDRGAAFWLGHALFVLAGLLAFPVALSELTWNHLSGGNHQLRAPFIKGALFGTGLFAATGLLLPLLGALSRVEGVHSPGFFALGAGVGTALWLWLAHLAFSLAMALVGWMSHGLSPLDTLGWTGVGKQGRRIEPA
jgi:hypothetical protein